MNRKDLPALCKQLRRDIINMIANGASGHPGGSLSVIDMLVALYFGKMNLDPCEPVNPQRDRLVLSKGHAAPALYACLGELGLIEKEEYTTFRQLHSRLQGHPDRNKCPGVEVSTGSLGQGCSIATGMALGAKACGNPCHIYAVLGDGECQEGIVWEASMAAAHYRLDNLTFLIDHNGLKTEMMWNRSSQLWIRLSARENHAASFVKRLKARAYPSWKIKWAGMARHQMKSSAGRRSGNWGNKA